MDTSHNEVVSNVELNCELNCVAMPAIGSNGIQARAITPTVGDNSRTNGKQTESEIDAIGNLKMQSGEINGFLISNTQTNIATIHYDKRISEDGGKTESGTEKENSLASVSLTAPCGSIKDADDITNTEADTSVLPSDKTDLQRKKRRKRANRIIVGSAKLNRIRQRQPKGKVKTATSTADNCRVSYSAMYRASYQVEKALTGEEHINISDVAASLYYLSGGKISLRECAKDVLRMAVKYQAIVPKAKLRMLKDEGNNNDISPRDDSKNENNGRKNNIYGMLGNLRESMANGLSPDIRKNVNARKIAMFIQTLKNRDRANARLRGVYRAVRQRLVAEKLRQGL